MPNKVVYSRDDFIRLADVKKSVAKKYCDENPKEFYDTKDFIAVYHSRPEPVYLGGTGKTMLWNEHSSDWDRIVDCIEEERWGE